MLGDREPRSYSSEWQQGAEAYGTAGFVAQAPAEVRASFLRKTYATLFGGVTIAIGTACALTLFVLTTRNPVLLSLYRAMGSGMGALLTIGAYMVLGMAVSSVARVKGINLLAFAFFTAFTGFVISPLLVYSVATTKSFLIVWQALGLTTVAFGALTGYVLVSGKDFAFMKGFLWTGFWIVLALIIVGIWIPSSAFHLALTCVGLLLFAGFVLYDTSEVMHRMMPDEYVAGALALFVDFINMFVRILRLLTQRN